LGIKATCLGGLHATITENDLELHNKKIVLETTKTNLAQAIPPRIVVLDDQPGNEITLSVTSKIHADDLTAKHSKTRFPANLITDANLVHHFSPFLILLIYGFMRIIATAFFS
jgi:hypothetical protein